MSQRLQKGKLARWALVGGIVFSGASGVGRAQKESAGSQKVYTQQGHRWFEDIAARATISPDGRWVLFSRFGNDIELASLSTGKEDPVRLRGGLDQVEDAVFCGGELLRKGKRGPEEGWFLNGPSGLEHTAIKLDAFPVCSSDGRQLAYFSIEAASGDLFVGSWKKTKRVAVLAPVTGAAFSPNGQVLYALTRQPDGGSSLIQVDVRTGQVTVLKRDLDASPSLNQIGLSESAKQLYLSLASEKAPEAAERQKAEAPRALQIYELDLVTRRLKGVVQSGVDKFAPTVVAGQLYWAQNVVRDSIAALPSAGGAAHEVIAGAQVPSWSRDARRIGFVFGNWRLADWALNLDAGAVDVDAEAKRISDRTVVIAGNHEDFPPEWSPTGKWLAFHSHRASVPVSSYDAPGTTDDLWLRLQDDPQAPEIRLTDFGWETGSPSWAPDGRRMVFSSWERNGKPGVYRMWIATIDPESGRAIKSEKVPLHEGIRSAEWVAWSPVDETLAVEDESAPGERTIWVVSTDGSNAERLVTYKSDTYGGLDWTPDGKTIVYSALEDGRMQIFSLLRSGGAPKKLSAESANLMHPRVSPDGRWIACTRLETRQEIWRQELQDAIKGTAGP